MIHLGAHDCPLLSARFEAWDYGPVNRELYDATKRYGDAVLNSSNIPGYSKNVVAETHRSILDYVIKEFSSFSATELIRITHQEYGAWKKTFNPRYRSMDIPDRLIKEEYEERLKLASNLND